ncbi:hypothetical protein CWS72_27220, partial [Telmatospirillum siberiense]
MTSAANGTQNETISVTAVKIAANGSTSSSVTTAAEQSNNIWQVTLSNGTALSITGSQNFANGAANLSLGGSFYFQDGAGNAYALDPSQSANGTYQITALSTGATINLTADATRHMDLSGTGLTIDYGNGGQFHWIADAQGATGDYYNNGVLVGTVRGAQTLLNADSFGATTATSVGGLGDLQQINGDGSLGSQTPFFMGSESYGPPASSDAASLEATLTAAVPTDAPVSVPTFSKTALGVTVTDLATAAQTAAGSGGDG